MVLNDEACASAYAPQRCFSGSSSLNHVGYCEKGAGIARTLTVE